MMRSVIVSAAIFLLCGCTTVKEMREHAPNATYHSSRSSAALEHCLAGSLSWAAQPSIIHGEGTTELAYGQGDATAVLVTLIPEGGGTQVEAREKLAYGVRVRHNVEACVSGADK
jgi:hypothetical protein